MHFLACSIVAVVAFGAGALYAHSLLDLVVGGFKKEMAEATAEIKKIRGEIVNLNWRQQ